MSDITPPLVLHVIYSLGTGGLENGLVNIINRTPPDKYRHAIICLTTAHEFADRITAPGVKVIELRKKEGKDLASYWRLFRLLNELRPDILHTRNLAALDTQLLGFLFPATKQVHGEHGRDIYDLDGNNWKYRYLRKFMRPFVDCYIAVSRDLEHWLRVSIGVKPGRLRQIYNGVDYLNFKPGRDNRIEQLPATFLPPEPAVVLGTVGRLVEVKDQLMILKALDRLLREEPALRNSLRVIIVGDGPLKNELECQVSHLNLQGLVWMPGNRNDVPELLQTMDIFLLPSLAEGISNTVLEAMSTGLPVIATDTGGNPELIKDGVNGYLIPVSDDKSLAESIRSLIGSPALRKNMGQHAMKLVHERFDWSKTVIEYLKIYDDLLGIESETIVELRTVGSLNDGEAG